MKHSTNKETSILAAHDINIATNSDVEQVCNILGSAFTHDPVLSWLCGQPKIYGALFRSEAEALYKKHGHVYINRDETGAAMWLPAGVPPKPPPHWRLLSVTWLLATTSGISSLKRALELQKVFARNHPHESHFYLHAVGADSENQGRGIGSALIKAGLTACDKHGLPAYLESSNERNNPLYERHGFNIIGEARLPDSGPTIWFMHRDARKGSQSQS